MLTALMSFAKYRESLLFSLGIQWLDNRVCIGLATGAIVCRNATWTDRP